MNKKIKNLIYLIIYIVFDLILRKIKTLWSKK